MKKFIYGGRNGIYIIDLHQTLKRLEEACAFVRTVAAAVGRLALARLALLQQGVLAVILGQAQSC